VNVPGKGVWTLTFYENFGRIIDFQGNYEGPSKSIEAFVSSKFVGRSKANESITRFGHDQDASSMAILEQKGWNLAE
jgi:hypothetical protein